MKVTALQALSEAFENTVLQFWSDRHRDTPVDLFIEEPFDLGSEWENAFRQAIAPGGGEILSPASLPSFG